MKPQEKYCKEKTVSVNVRLMKSTEADIIEYLKTVDNKNGLIKRLLREEMKKSLK